MFECEYECEYEYRWGYEFERWFGMVVGGGWLGMGGDVKARGLVVKHQ